jgi:hypothetical protein
MMSRAVAPASGNQGAEGLRRGVLAPLLFLALTAGNGYRLWLASMPAAVFLSALLVVLHGRDYTQAVPLRGLSGSVVLAMAALLLAAGSSWLATGPDADTTLAFACSYFCPALVILALIADRWDAAALWRVLITTFAAAAFVLVHGLLRFYAEFGIPTGLDLVFARAQEARIEPYLRATWGNVGSTAAYLSLVLPPALVVSVWRDAPRVTRALARTVVLLAFLHFAIIQSRTLFLVLIACVLVTLRALRIRFRTALAIGAAVLLAILIPLFTVLDTLFGYLAGALQGPSGDTSVAERAEAMSYGWRSLCEYPLYGVGPGRSLITNPYTSAHEFILQLGSELGVPGSVAAILMIAVTWQVLWRAAQLPADERRWMALALGIGPAAYMLYAFLANAPLSQGAVSSWVCLWAAFLTLAARWVEQTDAGVRAADARDGRGP